jgi:DNA-binding transcriptional regulator GbsR (MarR family)
MGSLKDIKADFIRIYEGIAIRRGQSAILGRIMGAFFTEGRELSQKELSVLTGYSVSSVSRALDHMLALGIVQEHKDLSREYSVYNMSVDFLYLVIAGLDAFIRQAEASQKEIEALRKKMEATSFSKDEKAEANTLHARFRKLEEGMMLFAEISKKNIDELKSKL